MSIHAFAATASGICSLIAAVLYIASIVRGETVPSRATWIVWTVIGFIVVGSYYDSGARLTMVMPIINALAFGIIVVLAFYYGKKKPWNEIEKCCLIGALLSLPLWLITPIATVTVCLVLDAFGLIPTAQKSWKNPESESRLPWLLATCASVLLLLAIEPGGWTYAVAAYPIYMFFGNSLVTCLVFRRPATSPATS